MSDSRVSSLLVEEQDKLVGIVTDRDLRHRVLAHALPASTQVGQVMTRQPHVIDRHAFLYEAVQQMSQYNIHHLPVMEQGVCYGMLSATAIMRSQQLAALAITLHKQQVPAHEAGHVITTITDALTQRLIYLAQQQLGEAPCVFSWLAFGSQARMDQSLNADQDNALLLEKEPSGVVADYFSALADFVCKGLARCGIPLCPGNIMATNPELRLSLKGWSGRFARWIATPTPEALLKASIFFDLRVIDGSKGLFNALQQDILQRTSEAPLFLYHLAQAALQRTAPLGLFKNFILEQDGKHKKGLDLKKRGISLITDLVRVYALYAGIHEVNTRSRLQQLAAQGIIDSKDSQNLNDAFDLLAQLRSQRHHHVVLISNDVTILLCPVEVFGMPWLELEVCFAVIYEVHSRVMLRF